MEALRRGRSPQAFNESIRGCLGATTQRKVQHELCMPLNRDEDTADLAQALGLPVILVVGMRLGCLNHALLTAQAIRARRLRLAGWIANRIDPAMAVADENITALAERLRAPLLGEIEFTVTPDSLRIAAQLDLSKVA